MSNSNTTVTSETMDLSDMFPVQGEDGDKGKTFFQNDTPINLDDDDEEEEITDTTKAEEVKPVETPAADEPAKPAVPTSTATPSIDDLEKTEEFEKAKDGSKKDLVVFFKAKIEAGDLVPFSDYDETKQTLDEYLKTFKDDDFDKLWNDNREHQKKELAETLPQEFFDALPSELQYAAKYAQEGGTDFKGLFRALAQVEEIKALDPKTDARRLNEQYLRAKGFDDEYVKEQLDEWDDLSVQEKKAEKFKPEMEKMQTQLVQQQIDQQAERTKQQAEQYNFFHDHVVEAIRTEDLKGVKLDKKTQSALYTGLTQHTFKDSRGKQCTQFEYELDQIMWVKPDYQKLAKIQWLLQDEDAFEKALSTKKVNANTEETIRTLKTEQAKKKTGVPESAAPPKRLLPRGNGLFQR